MHGSQGITKNVNCIILIFGTKSTWIEGNHRRAPDASIGWIVLSATITDLDEGGN